MPGDQCVARIRTLGIRGDQEVGLFFEWNILGAVHRDVDFAGKKCARDCRDENALARRHVDRPEVAFGDDRHELHVVALPAKPRGDQLALHQRQPRTASAQPDRHGPKPTALGFG